MNDIYKKTLGTIKGRTIDGLASSSSEEISKISLDYKSYLGLISNYFDKEQEEKENRLEKLNHIFQSINKKLKTASSIDEVTLKDRKSKIKKEFNNLLELITEEEKNRVESLESISQRILKRNENRDSAYFPSSQYLGTLGLESINDTKETRERKKSLFSSGLLVAFTHFLVNSKYPIKYLVQSPEDLISDYDQYVNIPLIKSCLLHSIGLYSSKTKDLLGTDFTVPLSSFLYKKEVIDCVNSETLKLLEKGLSMQQKEKYYKKSYSNVNTNSIIEILGYSESNSSLESIFSLVQAYSSHLFSRDLSSPVECYKSMVLDIKQGKIDVTLGNSFLKFICILPVGTGLKFEGNRGLEFAIVSQLNPDKGYLNIKQLSNNGFFSEDIEKPRYGERKIHISKVKTLWDPSNVWDKKVLAKNFWKWYGERTIV